MAIGIGSLRHRFTWKIQKTTKPKTMQNNKNP